MAEKIRVLHFADAHIGMENFGKTDSETGVSGRVLDFLRRLDEMIAFARSHEVDLVAFAGDAFKNATPTPTYQREFAHRIRELSELAPTVLLVGNHDQQPNRNKATSIDIYDTLAVPNVIVADTFDVYQVETKRGRVIVGTAPYPIRARLLEQQSVQGLSLKEINERVTRALYDILAQLAEKADAYSDVPRLLMGHFTVGGAIWGSERSVMLGNDSPVPLDVIADPRWDYVALGHIHKHQHLTKNRPDLPPVLYSGSIERVDFGEEHEEKGFCWVELARGDSTWHFQPVSARPMITVRLDCEADNTPTQTVLNALKKHRLEGAIIRLILKLSPETDALLKEEPIRDMLRKEGVYHLAGIKRDVQQPERSRLGTLTPESLSQEELLERYFMAKNMPSELREKLLEIGRKFLQEDSLAP